MNPFRHCSPQYHTHKQLHTVNHPHMEAKFTKFTVSSSPESNDSIVSLSLTSGMAGAFAKTFQIITLMPFRTTMNHLYRYNSGSTFQTMKNLYSEAGLSRFWKGLPFALILGPLARFGDTAANTGVIRYFENRASHSVSQKSVSHDSKDSQPPLFIQTGIASLFSASWKMFLTPLDTFKTSMQVDGSKGLLQIRSKVAKYGVSSLYHGSLGNVASGIVGFYPWFLTLNSLERIFPIPDDISNWTWRAILHNAFFGFSSSIVSDVVSNPIRVLKTYRQTYPLPISYADSFVEIKQTSGINGVLFRGLSARIIGNAAQSILFTVLWKGFQAELQPTNQQ